MAHQAYIHSGKMQDSHLSFARSLRRIQNLQQIITNVVSFDVYRQKSKRVLTLDKLSVCQKISNATLLIRLDKRPCYWPLMI